MRVIGVIFFVALLAVSLSFSLLNSVPVTVNYYFGSVELPLVLALMATLTMGVLLGVLGMLTIIFKLKRESMRLKKVIKASERELSQLRALPVKDRG